MTGAPLASAGRDVRPADRRFAFAILVVVGLFNSIDRMLVSILQEPIKHDLGLSDTQLGLLTGLSFAIFYSTMTIPMAWIADRFSRKRFMAFSLALWSAMTALGGIATSFLALVLCRMGVALGESSGTPTTLSLFSDYYPMERRGTPIAIWTMAVPIGTVFALLGGGWIGATMGWREVFLIAGGLGLLLAPFVLLIKEPERGRQDTTKTAERAPPLRDALLALFAIRSFHLVLAGGAMQCFLVAASQYWAFSFYTRVHGLSPAEIIGGLVMAFGVGGGLGAFAGGWLLDRLGAPDRRWYGWLPAITSVVSIPLVVAQFAVDSALLAMTFGTLAMFVLSLVLAPLNVVTQSLVTANMRAITSAVALIAFNVAGLGLGTFMTGVLSDLFIARGADNLSLRYALLCSAVVAAPGFLFFLRAAKTLPGDLPARPAQ